MTDRDVEIIRINVLSIQVCTKKGLSVEEIEQLANTQYKCGTTTGWIFNESLGVVDCINDKNREHRVLSI